VTQFTSGAFYINADAWLSKHEQFYL